MNEEQLKAATQSMIDWLAHPQELGKAPSKIECTGTFVRNDMLYYIFRYKKGILGRWLLGVCGGYEGDELENCGHVISDMEPYDPDEAEDDAIALVDSIRSYWAEAAESPAPQETAPEQEAHSEPEAEETSAPREEPASPKEEPQKTVPAPAEPFVGFALLSQPSWDKEQFLRDLKQFWAVEPDQRSIKDESVMLVCGKAKAVVAMTPSPVPNGEAVANAKNNYMWKEAVSVAEAHQAHLTVAVLDRDSDPRQTGLLFVKLMDCCSRQCNVTGLYTSGTIMEPGFYREAASVIKSNQLPVLNWIWFQLYRSEKGMCCYTYGMKHFGKDEMEILDADGRPAKVRALLIEIAAYLLKHDAELKDGNTIGSSTEDKHAVTRSKGVALPGMTLKIEFKPC